MYGVALGDALGLGTEFMSVGEVKHHYPDGMRHFSQIIRDAHRCMWQRGDWTNDTLVNHLLVESILDNGHFDASDLAKRISRQYKDDPHDFPGFYSWLVNNPDWEEQPLREAHDLWTKHHMGNASNEALPRAIITGILGEPRLLGNTLDAISVTHDDSRCTTCGVLIAAMADSLLRKDEPASIDDLDKICNTFDPRTREMLHIAYEGELEDIGIDDPESLWHTRKTMAAALWPIWHCNSAEETLNTVVDAGGDADTNGAVAMGLAGLKYGYDALPDEIEKLVQHEVVEDIANRFAAFIEEKERNTNS